jgi:hypothetical protein
MHPKGNDTYRTKARYERCCPIAVNISSGKKSIALALLVPMSAIYDVSVGLEAKATPGPSRRYDARNLRWLVQKVYIIPVKVGCGHASAFESVQARRRQGRGARLAKVCWAKILCAAGYLPLYDKHKKAHIANMISYSYSILRLFAELSSGLPVSFRCSYFLFLCSIFLSCAALIGSMESRLITRPC